MTRHERITSNPEVMVGKPVIRGTRITVELATLVAASALSACASTTPASLSGSNDAHPFGSVIAQLEEGSIATLEISWIDYLVSPFLPVTTAQAVALQATDHCVIANDGGMATDLSSALAEAGPRPTRLHHDYKWRIDFRNSDEEILHLLLLGRPWIDGSLGQARFDYGPFFDIDVELIRWFDSHIDMKECRYVS